MTDYNNDKDSFRRPEGEVRSLLAIGDLHGDYHRLVRYLRENHVLEKDSLTWNPQKKDIDIVLIGDYVDWRQEPLEGPESDWVAGSRNILELIRSLTEDVERLQQEDEEFNSQLFALLGNHDQMMLDAYALFDFIDVEEVGKFLDMIANHIPVRSAVQSLELGPTEVDRVWKFLNWFIQGGQVTMEGFGGLRPWKDSMDEGLGDFLKRYLRLAVIIDDNLFSHTIPDQPAYWKPLSEIMALPEDAYIAAREKFLWSRKVWGYDYTTGGRCAQFSEEELESLLSGFGVARLFVGHTPLNHAGRPVVSYDGRVVNLDQHAFPGSEAWVEMFQSKGILEAPLRQDLMKQESDSEKDLQGKVSSVSTPE